MPVICPKCGTKIEDGLVFCSYCGSNLMPPEEPPAEPVLPEPEPVLEEPAPVQPEPEPVFEEPEPAFEEPITLRPEPKPAHEDLINVLKEIQHTYKEPEPVFKEPEPVFKEPEPVFREPEPAPVRPQPAPVPPQQIAAQDFPDYMVIHVIFLVASLLCIPSCIPIVSLITSTSGIVVSQNCRRAKAAGDWVTAASKSRTSKTLWIASAIIMVVSLIFFFIMIAIANN